MISPGCCKMQNLGNSTGERKADGINVDKQRIFPVNIYKMQIWPAIKVQGMIRVKQNMKYNISRYLEYTSHILLAKMAEEKKNSRLPPPSQNNKMYIVQI